MDFGNTGATIQICFQHILQPFSRKRNENDGEEWVITDGMVRENFARFIENFR